VTLDLCRWYHIGISVTRSKFRHCQLMYYVNGQMIENQRLPFVSNGPSSSSIPEFSTFVFARLGQPAFQTGQSSTAFEVAALYAESVVVMVLIL
jgi:hypothetical protein